MTVSTVTAPVVVLTVTGFIARRFGFSRGDEIAAVFCGSKKSLASGLPLAKVLSTSPSSGEGNVSVNRETILRFSQPLSTNAMVGTNHLFATFGGRRIL